MEHDTIRHWIGALTPELPAQTIYGAGSDEQQLTLTIRLPHGSGATPECLRLDLILPADIMAVYEEASEEARGAADTRLLQLVKELLSRCAAYSGGSGANAHVTVVRASDLELVV